MFTCAKLRVVSHMLRPCAKCFSVINRWRTTHAGPPTQNVDTRETEVGRRSYLDIPRPRHLPIIGTAIDFFLAGAGKRLHKYIDHRHQQLGPIFRETLGQTELVFVSSADGIRDMFKYEGKYPKHPIPDSWRIYNAEHQCKRGLFFMDDEEWLVNRKLMNSLMMPNNTTLFNAPIKRLCLDLCDDFGKLVPAHSEEFVDVPNLIESLYQWAINGVTEVALGTAALTDPEIQPLQQEFSQSLHKLFAHTAPLMSFPPLLAKQLGLRVWTQYVETASAILSMANRLVELSFKHSINEPCLVAGMAQRGMDKNVIKRVFADLIIAAGDTTAFSTQWALYLLAKNEQAQQKVFEDVKHDLDNMECGLIRGTVREALRMYPVAFFIGRQFAVDGTIENYTIPKDTMVLASLFTSGFDDSSFPRAREFQPWRWLRQENGRYSSVLCPSASVPYALGARSCVGQKLANIQMHYLISTMLRNFELKLLNQNAIGVDIRFIPVPTENIQLGLRRRRV